MNTFFDKTSGLFKLDEEILQNDSYKKIMQDGLVTGDELKSQSEKVIGLFKALEENLPEHDLALVKDTFTELAVLYAINQYKEFQDLKR